MDRTKLTRALASTVALGALAFGGVACADDGGETGGETTTTGGEEMTTTGGATEMSTEMMTEG